MPTEASEVSSAAADQLKSSKPVQLNPHTCTYQLFVRWRRAIEDYVTATDVVNLEEKSKKAQARLFVLAGPDFSQYVRALSTYSTDLSPSAIIESVASQLEPQRKDFLNRTQLLSRVQAKDESASAYKNALKKLLDESNYPVKISRDQLFRDLFVHGLHNQDVPTASTVST